MVVSSAQTVVEKDFKAVIREGRIQKIGVEFLEHVMMAQPLYHLKSNDWEVWLRNIISFCSTGKRQCYAENAFNEVSDQCRIFPLDVKERLCSEIDTPEDLEMVRRRLV
jgi:phosphoenolpyruvate phosphomutase